MTASVKRVVLVVIDGLRPDAIERFSLFNLRRLVERGASTLTARSVSPDFAAARLTSLLTGVSPSAHGVIAKRAGLPRVLGRVEPLARVVAGEGFQVSGFLPEVSSALASGAGLTGRALGFQQLSFKGCTSADIVSSALNALCTQRRGLLALHLPDTARASDSPGTSTDYGDAARRIDQSVGLLASLSGAASSDSLLVIVGDHRDDNDLKSSDVDASGNRISVIIFGRCVSSCSLDGISLLDISPTILWSLGIPIPLGYEGRPLTEAFESMPVPARAFA